jgi:hypothetical protein
VSGHDLKQCPKCKKPTGYCWGNDRDGWLCPDCYAAKYDRKRDRHKKLCAKLRRNKDESLEAWLAVYLGDKVKHYIMEFGDPGWAADMVRHARVIMRKIEGWPK